MKQQTAFTITREMYPALLHGINLIRYMDEQEVTDSYTVQEHYMVWSDVQESFIKVSFTEDQLAMADHAISTFSEDMLIGFLLNRDGIDYSTPESLHEMELSIADCFFEALDLAGMSLVEV